MTHPEPPKIFNPNDCFTSLHRTNWPEVSHGVRTQSLVSNKDLICRVLIMIPLPMSDELLHKVTRERVLDALARPYGSFRPARFR